MAKRSLKDVFAEGSMKDNQMLERLGTQRHERAMGEQELKRRKLEQRGMEKRHQREREHEQHEFHMLQMRMMMSRNQQGAGAAAAMMQSPTQTQPSYEGLGLLAELNDGLIPSSSSYST
jgi:hypothetical protein